jgi:hypothetical protein
MRSDISRVDRRPPWLTGSYHPQVYTMSAPANLSDPLLAECPTPPHPIPTPRKYFT